MRRLLWIGLSGLAVFGLAQLWFGGAGPERARSSEARRVPLRPAPTAAAGPVRQPPPSSRPSDAVDPSLEHEPPDAAPAPAMDALVGQVRGDMSRERVTLGPPPDAPPEVVQVWRELLEPLRYPTGHPRAGTYRDGLRVEDVLDAAEEYYDRTAPEIAAEVPVTSERLMKAKLSREMTQLMAQQMREGPNPALRARIVELANALANPDVAATYAQFRKDEFVDAWRRDFQSQGPP